MEQKNIPYVKKYDANGNVSNQIVKSYINEYPNRKQRLGKEKRFKGNQKGSSFTIIKGYRFERVLQYILTKTGIKRIEHYKPC